MKTSNEKRVGIALGGGAVRGLAHIGLLKLLDKHDIQPHHISGTSMGAIIAALYAHGLSGEDIEQRVRAHIIQPGEKFKQIFDKRDKLLKWTKVFALEKTRGGLVTADGLFTHLFDELVDLQFSDLTIPTTIPTTNFFTGEELALSEGSVFDAVRASMAVPGVFAPVSLSVPENSAPTKEENLNKEALLVDGGLVNNLPTSHIQHCDLKIASDVISIPKLDSENKRPKTLDVVNGGINIMIAHSTKASLLKYPADLVNHVDLAHVAAFDFHKIDEVLAAGDLAALKIEAQLLSAL